MQRYNKITEKNAREIVLLKSTPCKWGRCTFCDYIEDNSKDESSIVTFNKEVLKEVTGEFKQLEVINSGSCFELPLDTLKDIRKVVQSKNIEVLYFESHYMYRERLEEIRDFFDVKIVFKCGIETFDDYFRNHVLKKGVKFESPQEVSQYFESICLMVGIEGQTKEMVKRDIEIVKKYFKRGCINVYINNNTEIKRDQKLVDWFCEEYEYLKDVDKFEVLFNNTDFGVGGEDDIK